MSYYVQLTAEAAELLLSEARWYVEASGSLDVATNWYVGFLAELNSLEQNPRRGGLAPENGLFEFELRELLYGSGKRITHRALYRIVEHRIEVLSIRHHAQRPLSGDEL